MKKYILILILLIFITSYSFAQDDWVSPTGHIDSDDGWDYETQAYDGDTGTTAAESSFPVNKYLELTIDAINCDKIRVYVNDWNTWDADLAIGVYYSGGWHEIFSGTVAQDTWVEKTIGSTESVTAMRIKVNTVQGAVFLWEAEFNQIMIIPTYNFFGYNSN